MSSDTILTAEDGVGVMAGPVDHDTLGRRVHAALDIAVGENGYVELLAQDPIDVAADLCEHEGSLDDVDPTLVIPHVISWQQKHARPGP